MKNLRVCVYGLGHLGQVTAACLAELGIHVTCFGQFDYNVEENNLRELVEKNDDRINFRANVIDLPEIDYLWVTFDTPVEGEDKANADYVVEKIEELIQFINYSVPIIISSQLPIGTIQRLEEKYREYTFASVPENLRHGTAIQNFLNPDRIIIGTRFADNRKKYYPLLSKISKKIVWVRTESAEMIKHSINAFLAMCITFANEIGDLCKEKQIDYNEVLMGLQSEARIGEKLPLKTGKAYTGGTLARDIKYLINMTDSNFFKSIKKSNDKRLKK